MSLWAFQEKLSQLDHFQTNYSHIAVAFTRKLKLNMDAYQAGQISFAELDASVQGWINHVRYADTWGLREHLFSQNPISGGRTAKK